MAYGTKCGERITDIFITEEELIDATTTGWTRLSGSICPGGSSYGSGATMSYDADLLFKGTTANHILRLQCLASTSASRNRLIASGDNSHGQLGNFTTINASFTYPIDCADWVCAAMGAYHSLAVREDGSLWAWGRNNHNQIGDTNTISRSSPVQVSASGWKKVAAGAENSFAISSNNQLYAWGRSDYGQSGIPSVSTNTLSTPLLVGSDYKCVSAGDLFALALKTDNTLWTWGYNEDGRLGLGDTISRSSPVQLCSNKLWKKISAGPTQSAAVDLDGNIYVWGCNYCANLGIGASVGEMVSCPVQINTGTLKWREVSIGINAGAAITTGGNTYVWGVNCCLMLGTSCALLGFYRNQPVVNCSSKYDIESVNVNNISIQYQLRTNPIRSF